MMSMPLPSPLSEMGHNCAYRCQWWWRWGTWLVYCIEEAMEMHSKLMSESAIHSITNVEHCSNLNTIPQPPSSYSLPCPRSHSPPLSCPWKGHPYPVLPSLDSWHDPSRSFRSRRCHGWAPCIINGRIESDMVCIRIRFDILDSDREAIRSDLVESRDYPTRLYSIRHLFDSTRFDAARFDVY